MNTQSELPKLSVFISHAAEDLEIARELENAIGALCEKDAVEIFLDYNHIEPGSAISEDIMHFLRKTDYFIGIATQNVRNQFSWCGLELGYFLARANDAENRHVNYLYHSEIQDVFKPYKGTRVVELSNDEDVSKAPLYRLLRDIGVKASRRRFPKEPVEYFHNLPTAAKAGALSVTKIYHQLVRKQRYPQGRIGVTFEPGLTAETLPESIKKATVGIYPRAADSLEIPGASGDGCPVEMKWPEFNDKMEDRSGGPYLSSILYDIIDEFLPKQYNANNDYLFQGPRKHVFRVILIRYQTLPQGSEFVFNLIETLAPLRGGDPETTLIASAIVLAAQFRSLFIEHDATYAIRTMEVLRDQQFSPTVKGLLRDLRRIRIEADMFGLTEDALKEALGAPDQVGSWYAIWKPLVANVEKAARDYIADYAEPNRSALLAAHRAMVEQMIPVNRAFMLLCLQAYKDIVGRTRVEHIEAASPLADI
jgi:hypothetical protein